MAVECAGVNVVMESVDWSEVVDPEGWVVVMVVLEELTVKSGDYHLYGAAANWNNR